MTQAHGALAVLATSLMKIANDDFTKMFTVGIQFGAILSVLVLYSKSYPKYFYILFEVAFVYLIVSILLAY